MRHTEFQVVDVVTFKIMSNAEARKGRVGGVS